MKAYEILRARGDGILRARGDGILRARGDERERERLGVWGEREPGGKRDRGHVVRESLGGRRAGGRG